MSSIQGHYQTTPKGNSSLPPHEGGNEEVREDFISFFPSELAIEIFSKVDPGTMRTKVYLVSHDWRFLGDDEIYWKRELGSIFQAFSDNLRVKNAQFRYAQCGEKNPKEIVKFLFEDLYETVKQIAEVLHTRNPAKFAEEGIIPAIEGSAFKQFTMLENTLFELTDELIGPDLPPGHIASVFDYPPYMSDIESFLTNRFVVEWFPRLAEIKKTFLFDSVKISKIAIQRNDYATLDWLTETSHYYHPFLGDTSLGNNLFYSLYESNNLAMLKYLFAKKKLLNFEDDQNLSARQNCVKLAILNGHFELLQWTQEIGLYHFENTSLQEGWKWAIALLKTGNPDILTWCCENDVLPSILLRDYPSVMEMLKSSDAQNKIANWIQAHPSLNQYLHKEVLNLELRTFYSEKIAQSLFRAYQLDC